MEQRLASGIILPDGIRSLEGKSDRISERVWSGYLPDWSAVSKFRDYQSYLRAIRIPWVFACVSVISYNFASTPYTLKDEDENVIDDPGNPLLQLLARPNAMQSTMEFLELYQMYLELTGNAYITLEEMDGNGCPREIYLADPSRMRVKPGPTGPQGYVYDPSGQGNSLSRMIPYEPNEVVHIKYGNPLDPWYGFGNIEASETLMDLVTAMSQNELGYWQSGGRIVGALETDKALNDPEFDRLKRDWQMANADAKQRARTVILEQGLKYQPIAEGFKSLDIVNIDKSKRDAILAVFGVPLPKLGIMEMAQYKMDEADAFFWQETMDPKFSRAEDGLQPLVDRYDPSRRLEWERKTFEDDQYLIQNATSMLVNGYGTLDEARQLVGMDPLPNGQGQVLYMNTSYSPVPLNQMATLADQTLEPPPPPARPAASPPGSGEQAAGGGNVVHLADYVPGMKQEEIDRLVSFKMHREAAARVVRRSNVKRRNKRTGPYARLQSKKLGTTDRMPDPPNRASQRHPVVGEAIRQHRNRVAQPIMQAGAEAIRGATAKLRKRVMSPKNLMSVLKGETPEARKSALQNVWSPYLRDALMPIYAQAIPAGAAMGANVLPPKAKAKALQKRIDRKATVAYSNPPAGLPRDVVDSFPQLGDKIDQRWQSIDDTTLQAINDQIEEGIRRGYTSLQIANGYADEDYAGIQGVFDDMSEWRADTIARTETMNSYSWGQWSSFTDANVGQIEASDGTEFDPECAERDGQVYDMDPASGEPIDNGYGTDDHPNGTLVWIPLAESISDTGGGDNADVTSEGE